MAPHRVLAVALQEARAQARSPLALGLVAFALFATLFVNPAAMIPSGDLAIGGVRPFSNSRHALAQSFALTGLIFYTFLTSLLAGLSALREDEARVGDLLHSTPLTAAEYITGKFAGMIAALFAILAIHVTLAMAWYEGGAMVGARAILGPFQLLNYVVPALVFLAPGIVFCAALSFAAGVRLRSALAIYAGPTGLFFFALAGLIPRPASWLDPVLTAVFSAFDIWGARWLSIVIFQADRGVEYYNTAALAFDGPFLLNRAFVLLTPLLAIVFAVRHSRGRVRGARSNRQKGYTGPPTALPSASLPTAPRWRELGMTSKAPAALRSALEMARADVRQLWAQPGAWLFILFSMLLTLESAGSMRGIFDSEVILTSGGLAVQLIETLSIVGCLMLMFHIVEALDRPRRLGLHPLIASTPARDVAILFSPWLSGALLLSTTLAACAGVAAMMQALQRTVPIDLMPFVLVWGLLLGPTFLAWAAFVTATFAVTRSRSATCVVGIAALMGTGALLLSGGMTWLTNWPLWGALRWSDMGLFELDREALVLNRLVALGAALGLSGLAVASFRRCDPDPVSRRAWPIARLVAAALLTAVPAFTLSQRIDDGVDGRRAREAAADYRRLNTAAWGAVAPPGLVHVDARIDLEPALGRMQVRGTFEVENRSESAVTRLPFTVGPGFQNVSWSIEGAPVAHQDRAGLHVLPLPRPLAAGARASVAFAYEARVPRGASRNGGGASEFILPSGVALDTQGQNFLPTPGFVEGIGVNAQNRIDPAEASDDHWRSVLPPVAGPAAPFTARMEVTAPAGYTVNGVGRKIRESDAAGRTTVVWETEHPVRFLNLVAGRWASRKGEGVAVFHHPAHAHNAEVILRTLESSRRLFSTWFRPYPWSELRLSEFPDHATRARSFPTNIPFSEGIGFLTRRAGDAGGIDLPVVVTAHEAAHQWWAHLLMPGAAPGADVLLEGMAHYSTLLLLEAEHGDASRAEFARGLESRYVGERRADAERPLLRIVDARGATDETAVQDKGAWVLWMLDELLGREAMLKGLRSFIARFEGSRDHPALHDLIEELRPLAPSEAAYETFVDQWFRKVTLPEFQIRGTRVERTSQGWALTATIANVGGGDVSVEVAALAGAAEARTSIRLAAGGEAVARLVTPFEPEALRVDPGVRVLQLHRDRAQATLARQP
jgi:ABC-2 type transport system permease protein